MWNKDLLEYAASFANKESDLLAELYRETYLKVINPRMIAGKWQGAYLSMISKIICPKKILEIGTFTGYSALCLCEGLQDEGQLDTIEKNPEVAIIAEKYFRKSNYEKFIQLHVGSAIDIIPNLKNNYNLVFIDGDKKEYTQYYDLVIDKVVSGGLIIADNVLWNGKVVEPVESNDIETNEILKFNEMVKNDYRVFQVIVPIRDGMMLIYKK